MLAPCSGHAFFVILCPRGQLLRRDGHCAVEITNDTSEFTQPELLLCTADQRREIVDVVDGESALRDTSLFGATGHRLKHRCDSSTAPLLLACGVQDVQPYDLVVLCRHEELLC